MFNPTTRFSDVADFYAQYRPSYPDEAIAFVMEYCQPSADALLVDVGCGTGIASRLFANKGLTVIGIEPNSRMLDLAKSESNLTCTLSFRKATAEATGLDSQSVNIVLAAQSFHWFDSQAALEEFYRILKPKGWLVLFWNERDESDAFTKAYGDVFRTFPETVKVELPRQTAGNALLASPLFVGHKKLVFANEQILDERGILGRAFSTSYAPKNPKDIETLSCLLRQIFKHYEKSGVVKLKYQTVVYLAQRQ